MIKHGILCSICVVMLSACTIGPNFEKPLFGLEESSWINGGNTKLTNHFADILRKIEME